MLKKLIQAATITSMLYLVMGMSSPESVQTVTTATFQPLTELRTLID
ncbi:MAG: hypothetical protein HC769_09375 [Cyanobacteria bacterium CRU_2_1]|nr:hypothetical protein [Cyanobacteria bacterium RU_5_0]NJR59036.1 hypothetical protein [Cyanobacteria bacterium CRU_2_1]